MKRLIPVVGIMLCVFASSCVPYKNTVYLQNKSSALDSTQVMVEAQKPYRVQINDVLNIRVKSLDQENVRIFNPIGDDILNADSEQRAYFDGFTVDLHGDIRMPSLGKLRVLGLTTEEIEQMVEKKLLEEQFKETANIFVTVKLTGLRYVTFGETRSKGTKILYQERANIFQAIANSGGILETGDKMDVLIIRQYPQGQKIHHLDLTDINVQNSPYYYIQHNDMIYVKPLKTKALGTGTTALQNLTAIVGVLSLVTTTILVFKL